MSAGGPDDLAERIAWSALRIAALVNVLGMPIELLIGAGVAHIPVWPVLVSMGVGSVIAIATVARPPDADRRIASALFVVNAASVALAFLARDAYYAASTSTWVPFQGTKLACFVVAMLAPGPVSGLAALVVHAGSSLLSYALLPGELRDRIGHGEPWITLVFGAIGAVLLASRLRREQLDRELVRARADARSAQHLARTVLAIRHLANTPLQTIAVTAAVLARQCPESSDLVARQERALERLRALQRMLARYDAMVQWDEPIVAFDARSQLDAVEPAAPIDRPPRRGRPWIRRRPA